MGAVVVANNLRRALHAMNSAERFGGHRVFPGARDHLIRLGFSRFRSEPLIGKNVGYPSSSDADKYLTEVRNIREPRPSCRSTSRLLIATVDFDFRRDARFRASVLQNLKFQASRCCADLPVMLKPGVTYLNSQYL